MHGWPSYWGLMLGFFCRVQFLMRCGESKRERLQAKSIKMYALLCGKVLAEQTRCAVVCASKARFEPWFQLLLGVRTSSALLIFFLLCSPNSSLLPRTFCTSQKNPTINNIEHINVNYPGTRGIHFGVRRRRKGFNASQMQSCLHQSSDVFF